MNKFKAAWKVALKFVDDNLPTILSGLALVGLGASVVSAAKDGAKAQEAIEDGIHRKLFTATDEELETMDAERVDEKPDDYAELGYDGMVSVGTADEVKDIILYKRKKVLTFWEKFAIYGKVYWKTATLTLLTGASIIASNVVSKKRYLGLAALVASQAKELDTYKDKVKEVLGEKKAEQVEKEIARDKMMECPEDIREQYVAGKQYPLHFLGCWWIGNKQEVEEAFTTWNRGAVDEAMRTMDDTVELQLDDLACELEHTTGGKFAVKGESLLNTVRWLASDGIVSPEFDLVEANGVPGYIVKTSRRPVSRYGYRDTGR